ncbi:MAG: HAMP domain-containing protein, partial [Chlorobiaceae bacterium]|nr:HAMP domain-containing protein [Chlorobiaceae bacterium]
MLVYFGITFALTVFVFLFFALWGIPFTEIQGEYYAKEKAALIELNMIADFKKNELKRYMNERRGDAHSFSESTLTKKQAVLLSTVFNQLKGKEKNEESFRAALIKITAYQDMLKHLISTVSAYSTYHSATIIDAETGAAIVSTDDRRLLADFSGDKNFIKAKDPLGPEFIDISKGLADSGNHLAIYHPIMDDETHNDRHVVRSVLLLVIDLSEYIKQVTAEERRLSKTGEIILVSDDQTLLSPLKFPLPDGSTVTPFQYKLLTKETVLAASGSEGIMRTIDYRGVPVLSAYRHLLVNSEMGWGIIVKVDESEVFGPIKQRLSYFCLVAFLVCAVVVIFSFFIASKLARPIQILSQTASKVGAGDLTVRSPLEGFDEVGILSQAFNSMMENMQESHNKLSLEIVARKGAQEELVKMVSDLSDALEKVNVLSG